MAIKLKKRMTVEEEEAIEQEGYREEQRQSLQAYIRECREQIEYLKEEIEKTKLEIDDLPNQRF